MKKIIPVLLLILACQQKGKPKVEDPPTFPTPSETPKSLEITPEDIYGEHGKDAKLIKVGIHDAIEIDAHWCAEREEQVGPRDFWIVYSERAAYPNFGCCEKCGRPWNCASMVSIAFHANPASPHPKDAAMWRGGWSEGIGALCLDCYRWSTKAERIKYYSRVWVDSWHKTYHDSDYVTLLKGLDSTKNDFGR